MGRNDERREDESFLAAWSRRKRAAKRAQAADTPTEREPLQPAGEGESAAVVEAPVEPEITEEELAALPRLEDVTGNTDLKPFFKRGVPQSLRKAAMRKVWLGNALIRNHDDPAVDYAWDWNSPEGVPGAGGTVAREKVAKMIDDLINKVKGKSEETVAPDPAVEPGEAGTEAVEGAVEGAVEAAAAEAVPAPQAAVATESRRLSVPKEASPETPSAASEEKGTHRVPARSHGGAVPI